MRNQLYFLLITALFHCAVNAQTGTCELKGKVVNDQNIALPLATVTLSNMQGNTVAKSITDSSGIFRLSHSAKGQHSLSITHTGYTTFTSTSFDLENKDLGTIQLASASNKLNNVTVQSQQKLIEVNAGSIIYNVAASISAQGATAFDALKQAPGVFINSDNTITLNGKAGVLILMDGKQSYLSGQELTDLLKSMPASNIKSFEIVNSPGAKYDAAGSSGIINIKTSKSQQNGFSGAVTAGISYGVILKQNQDITFNYRKNKLNLFGGYNHFIGNFKYLYGSYRSQSAHNYNSATDDTDKRKRMAARIGADYNINKRNTIGLLLNTNFVFGGGITKTTTEIAEAATGITEEILYADNDYYFQRTQRYNVNANYRYEDAAGTSLNIDADYGSFKKSNGNLQSNIYTDPQQVLLHQNQYRSLNDINIRLSAFKFDYTTNVWKGVMEAGAKYSSVTSGNDARFLHVLVHTDSFDARRSNEFAFTEQISAGYLNYKRTTGIWSYQAGLRVEHTQSKGLLTYKDNGVNNNEQTPGNYTNLFPSFSVAVKLKKNHNLSLAYSRRIDRPAYQDLNPFIYLLDELSFWQGNAFLQPQLSHRATLQYAFKSQTIVSLNYSYTNQFSARITDTIATSKIVMIPRNLGIQQNISLSLTQNTTLNKWWQFTFNGTVYRLDNKVSFDKYRHINLQQVAARLSMQHRFKLPGNMAAELSSFMNTKRLTGGNQLTRGNSQLDIAVQKSFLKNKATLRLAFHDLYKGNKAYAVQNLPGFYLSTNGYYESRQVRLNFTYKFENTNVKAPRSRNSALENENSRIN